MKFLRQLQYILPANRAPQWGLTTNLRIESWIPRTKEQIENSANINRICHEGLPGVHLVELEKKSMKEKRMLRDNLRRALYVTTHPPSPQQLNLPTAGKAPHYSVYTS